MTQIQTVKTLSLIYVISLVFDYYINFGVAIFVTSLCVQQFLVNSMRENYWKIVQKVDKTLLQKSIAAKKFRTQIEECVVHVISVIWMMKLIPLLNIFQFEYETYFGRIMTEQEIPRTIVDFYIFHMFSWSYQLVQVLFKEKHLRDKYHFILIGHHLLTITMLSISYYYNLFEFGVLVLWIHDSTDIVLDLCKFCNYLFLPHIGKWLMVLLNGVWLYWRIYVYGFFIYNCVQTIWDLAVQEGLPKLGIEDSYTFALCITSMLSTLLLLNVIWYFIMTYITINLFRKQSWAEKMNLLAETYE